MRRLACLALLLGILGCGYKGPLRLPPPPADAQQAPAAAKDKP